MITRLFRVLGPDADPLRRCVAGFVAEGILQGIGFGLLVPILRALIDGDTTEAWWWTLGLIGVLAVYATVRYFSQMAAYMAAIGLSRGLFQRLGDHIARLPLGWFESDRVGPVSRLTSRGVITVMGVPAHLLRPLITAVVTPTTVIVMMAVFDWRLALAAAITAPFAVLVSRWAAKRLQRIDNDFDITAADAASRVVEFAQTQPVLRAFGRMAEGHQLLDDALVTNYEAYRKMMKIAVPGLISFALVIQAAFTVVLVVGVSLATDGSINSAELIALLVLTVRYVEPLLMASEIGGALKLASNTLDRADTLLATPLLAEPWNRAQLADSSVQLDGVSFAYDEAPVLENLSLEIPAGTMTALVGPSGSGKTTVARLVARFWDPASGAVRIGGVDVREIPNEQLMGQLAMVFQDTYLFSGSVADNLLVARGDAGQSELDRVAQLARLDEVLERLPNGWNTEVGEGGTRLSGGERQRVAIARALLKDSPIVLLDEATAAIDSENDAAIQNALDTLRGERTLIVIAHRLQTVVGADQIAVLNSGHLVERGRHDELLAAGGRYADFWRERSHAAGWRLEATPR